jgi:lipopolysaccharide transport system ATP-binding protein
MATAIKVENLSKIYRLGEIGTGTISRDIERFIKTKILKQEDPFLKIGETNDRAAKGTSDIVYSLKDINFEIEQGDTVGIIGRNGAGKSTLLKILSRVTSPTTGKINIKGRVASLLEVGTGFHPELTGRENIYLNGAILGMRKREIDRKLDEIIDFSGVERYIDTPVKRYSSGMYVRLAFAVAAHLESEILIVDEVLAVGDAEFQKKCLGKMGQVSKGEGRTVLFVSHNMAAVQSFCATCILLENGEVKSNGHAEFVIRSYFANSLQKQLTQEYESTASKACISKIQLLSLDNKLQDSPMDVNSQLKLKVKIKVNQFLSMSSPSIDFKKDGVVLFRSFASDCSPYLLNEFQPGRYDFEIILPSPLKKGDYSIDVRIGELWVGDYDLKVDAIFFEIDELETNTYFLSYYSSRPGIIAYNKEWKIEQY